MPRSLASHPGPDLRLHGDVVWGAPDRRMGGAPFGPFKHQVLAVASATPRSFPKSYETQLTKQHEHDHRHSGYCVDEGLWRWARAHGLVSEGNRLRLDRGPGNRNRPSFIIEEVTLIMSHGALSTGAW